MIITNIELLLETNLNSPEIFREIKDYKSTSYDKLSLLHYASKYLRNTLCNYLINKLFIGKIY